MTPDEEFRHLVGGSSIGEVPGGAGTIRVVARAPGAADDVWRRSREVMAAILDHQGSSWPSVEQWRSILPAWFIETFREDPSPEEAEQWLAWWRELPPVERERATRAQTWTLADWLYWLEPTRRAWYWWNATVLDGDTLHVKVEVDGWPAPLGALTWLLRASGSTDVTVEGE